MNNVDLETRAQWLATLKHDLNNVFTSVKTGLEILGMDDHFEDPENAEDLADVIQASKRMATMLEDMPLVFADLQIQRGEKENTRPQDIVSELSNSLKANGLELEADLGAIEHISTDATMLHKALYYGCLAIGEYQRDKLIISCRLAKNGGFGWILQCSPDTLKACQEGLAGQRNQERSATLIQLSKQAVLHLGGLMNLKAAGSSAYIILNFKA